MSGAGGNKEAGRKYAPDDRSALKSAGHAPPASPHGLLSPFTSPESPRRPYRFDGRHHSDTVIDNLCCEDFVERYRAEVPVLSQEDATMGAPG